MTQNNNSKRADGDTDRSEQMRFVWKRVHTRLLLYLIVVLILILLWSMPIE